MCISLYWHFSPPIPSANFLNQFICFLVKTKYLIIFLFICFSCNRTKQTTETETFQPELIVEDSFVYYPLKYNRIKVELDKPQKASLFDYFSHIELIPLETNDNVLIGWIEEIVYYQGRYYVFDRQQNSVFVFDDKGRFIFQINKRGQGPGEYPLIRSIYLNPFTGNIDILGLSVIYSYDLSGKHVKTSPRIADLPNYPFNLIALDENTYVFYVGMEGQFISYRINYYDVEENKIFHQEYEDDPFLNNFLFLSLTSHTRFYEYHGKWFFYRFVDNITYEVGKDSLKEAYTWDFGKHNYDSKKLGLPNEPMSINTLPYRINLQGQNNRYVIAQIALRDNIPKAGVYIMYDKSTDGCKLVAQFTESAEFLPRKVTNEYVLSWAIHGTLEKYMTEEILDDINQQKFRTLINSKEEQNPIIIKYYFK